MSIPSNGTAFPPQLHLSIPPSTTSFKRSFEQFGFDLDDSPVRNTSAFGQSSSGSNGAGGSGPSLAVATSSSSGRDNNRNKRARSASSTSSGGSGSDYQSVSSSIPRSSLEVPPRLPTPDVDVDMADVNDVAHSPGDAAPDASITTGATSPYRLTLQRIHSPTSPPVLPPLRLSVDHEEDEPQEEPQAALLGDEPPRIHIDLPQAPLTISEGEEEETEELPAVIPPEPPTLPPIQTGDLFEPTTLPLHELRQWIDEAASPSAESSNSGLARSDVADPGTSRVILDVPSHSSPTNPEGETPGMPSPSRNRLQRSLGDFLSVAVEDSEDGDSPISSLFTEPRATASGSAFPWAGRHPSAETRRRTSGSSSAADLSNRPTSLSNFLTRRHVPFDEDDNDGVMRTPGLSMGGASRDTSSSTHNHGSRNAEGRASQASASSNAHRRSLPGRLPPTQTGWYHPELTAFDSSSDESESSQYGTTQPYYRAPFTSRRALLAEQPSFFGARSTATIDTTAPPRQVRFRTSASSVIGESADAVRARELSRLGLGSSTISSTSPATQRPAESQGMGLMANEPSRIPSPDTNWLHQQSTTTAQPPTHGSSASRMGFGRSAVQGNGSGPAPSAEPSSLPPFPSATPTFYPTGLHERAYYASNPSPAVRSAPRSRPRMPSFPSLFDYDMALGTDSESSGENSPTFGPVVTQDQQPERNITRTFVPPAIPSPNLDLSFTVEDSAAQSNNTRAEPAPRQASPAPAPAPRSRTTSLLTDGWPPFPDFPFAFDVLTNDLTHVPPSPSIEDPAPSLASRYAGLRARRDSTSAAQGAAATSRNNTSSAARQDRVPVDDWPLELNRLQEESDASLQQIRQVREVHATSYFSLMRERDDTWRSVPEPGHGTATARYAYPTPSFYGYPRPDSSVSSTNLPPSSSSSGPAGASHPGTSTAPTPTSNGRTNATDGAISSRFIPGPFSNTMRALERERNAADAARNSRWQHLPPNPSVSRIPPPPHDHSSRSTTATTPPVQIRVRGSSAAVESRPTPRYQRYMGLATTSVDSSDRLANPQRSTTTATTEDLTPGVRRLQAMQSLRDRLVELQGMGTSTASQRTSQTPTDARATARHSMGSSVVPFVVGSSRPANPFTSTPARRPTASSYTELQSSRAGASSNTTSARTGPASYAEDTTEPFSQAIESLREPRQSQTAASAAASASAEMTRRRARLEQLAEESRAMNRDRARIIRAEYLNRRRHSLNMRLGGFSSGDFVRDEEFDQSYEALLSLSSIVGEARPRGTPGTVLESMEKAKYEDWATPESDKRCPICLDDYTPMDQVMKLKNCSHWLHSECLEQWLKGANTCPVCRNQVHGSASSSSSSAAARRAYLPPTRYARATRLGLDRTPLRDTTTTTSTNNSASNASASISGTGSANTNGRNAGASNSTTTRAAPPPSSGPTYYRAFYRRDRDDDDTPGVGPSGSGAGSGSSTFSGSLGSFYRAF